MHYTDEFDGVSDGMVVITTADQLQLHVPSMISPSLVLTAFTSPIIITTCHLPPLPTTKHQKPLTCHDQIRGSKLLMMWDRCKAMMPVEKYGTTFVTVNDDMTPNFIKNCLDDFPKEMAKTVISPSWSSVPTRRLSTKQPLMLSSSRKRTWLPGWLPRPLAFICQILPSLLRLLPLLLGTLLLLLPLLLLPLLLLLLLLQSRWIASCRCPSR